MGQFKSSASWGSPFIEYKRRWYPSDLEGGDTVSWAKVFQLWERLIEQKEFTQKKKAGTNNVRKKRSS
ncbi:MAG: hypothetical protein QXV17_13310 [Candidatus Micrarchaeaceae archaeon]